MTKLEKLEAQVAELANTNEQLVKTIAHQQAERTNRKKLSLEPMQGIGRTLPDGGTLGKNGKKKPNIQLTVLIGTADEHKLYDIAGWATDKGFSFKAALATDSEGTPRDYEVKQVVIPATS